MARPPIAPLSEHDIATRLARELPRWRYEQGTLRRRFKTKGWKGSLMLATTIGHLAEVAWHHPDLVVTYGGVEVRLSTHSPKGITDRDFALAAKVEEVVAWRPGTEGGPLEGTPQDPGAAYLDDEA